MDLPQCANHIKRITDILRKHHESVDVESFIAKIEIITENHGTDFRMLWVTNWQKHHANPPAHTPSKFWRRSLIILYILHSVISLEQCFSENLPTYSQLMLHPHVMLDVMYDDFLKKIEIFVVTII